MDPKACLNALKIAIADGRMADADLHRNDLMSWLLKGGFAPDMSRKDLLFLLRGFSVRKAMRILRSDYSHNGKVR